MEFGARLPAHLKIRNGERKYILRRVAERGLVPPEIIHRSKQGFVLPLHSWMEGALKPLVTDALATLSARKLFYPQFLKRKHHGTRLYALFALERWLRTYAPDFQMHKG